MKRLGTRRLLLATLVATVFVACLQTSEEDELLGSLEEPINLASCDGAKVPCLPAPGEDDCLGPDGGGWSTKPRPVDAGPCPEEPEPKGCTQYVIGRQKDVEAYIGCKGFQVLNVEDKDYSRSVNSLFVSCGACGSNSTCPNKFVIASVDGDLPDYDKDAGPWVSTELCQLNKYCTVVTQADGKGYVKDCNCSNMAQDCTPDAGTPDSGTPDSGMPDAGTPDAGTPDAGMQASSPWDSGVP
jgi:hypothetical protein